MSTDLDTRLREYAARWRAAQNEDIADAVGAVPATLSALGSASPPPQRTRRRRIALTAAASVAAASALITTTLVHTQRHERSSVAITPTSPRSVEVSVPWRSAGVRADTSAVPPPAKPGAPAGLRTCADADFSLVSERTRPSASNDGWLTTTFLLRSLANTSCAVPNGVGKVVITLVASTGVALPVDGTPSGGSALPSMLLVRPGQLVSGIAYWAVYQGRTPRPVQLVINLSGLSNTAGALRVPLGAVTIPPHPRDPSNLGPWRSTAYGSIGAVTDAGTLASLTAVVSAPASVAGGEILRFTVTLTNPTATAVTLANCPDFVERLDVVPLKTLTSVGFRGPLNCARAPKTIGSGEIVSFQYELATAGELPGRGQLSWQLLERDFAAVTARAEVTVTP